MSTASTSSTLSARLRRLSLFAGFSAAGYRLWYQLAIVQANPLYVPPSGRFSPDIRSLVIDISPLLLGCLAYFLAGWAPLQIAARLLARRETDRGHD
jgi:hypothetical protein